LRGRRASGAHVAPLSTSFILAGIVHEVPSPPGAPLPAYLRSTTRTAVPRSCPLFSALARRSAARRFPPRAPPLSTQRPRLDSSRREPTAAPSRPPLLSNASAFVEFGIPLPAARAVRRRGNTQRGGNAFVVLSSFVPSIVWIRLAVLTRRECLPCALPVE